MVALLSDLARSTNAPVPVLYVPNDTVEVPSDDDALAHRLMSPFVLPLAPERERVRHCDGASYDQTLLRPQSFPSE